jgi:hypothetical protein
MTTSNKRGSLPANSADGGKPAFSDGKKTSTQASEKRRDPAPLAKGGAGKMFNEQQASPAKGGSTSHNDIKGPGEQGAEGGDHPTGFSGALPARAGQSGADNNTDPNYRELRQRKQAQDRFGSNDASENSKPSHQVRPSRDWGFDLKKKRA